MYVSENSIDLYLLENYPHKYISIYENIQLNEGSIGNLKKLLADVTKNIGLRLKQSGIDTKIVIGEIRKEISKSKNIIIDHLKKRDSFEASNELRFLIDRISFKLKNFYSSKGIIEKSIIILLFLFVLIMTLLLIVYSLINYTIIFIILIVFIPIMLTLIKIALSIVKFKHKSIVGFPDSELNKTIIKTSEKIGVDNKLVVKFLSNTSKKATDKIQKDFDAALEMKIFGSKGSITTKAILMIIKTIKDQTKSGLF